MKEFLKAAWKILKIVLVFFLFLGIIALAWYAIEIATLGKDETAVPFVDFILYLLGFGDIDSKDHYLQTAFSTLGLFAVTLLSSVFTVNLFDLRSKVKINSKIIIKQQAKLKLSTAGKDVYNLTATLISKCEQDVTTETQVYPFVAKKSSQELYFDIAPGAPIYKYLRAVYSKTVADPQLILTVSYTDIESGQEYMMAQKYQHSFSKNSNFIFSDDDSEIHNEAFEQKIRRSIEKRSFQINLASVFTCNSEDIDLNKGYQDHKINLSEDQAFSATVHMNSNKVYEPGTFTMAATKKLLDNDWSIYRDLGCSFKFNYWVKGDITVTMELKCGPQNAVKREARLRPCGTFENYELSLKDISSEDLMQISELCFTVFYRDVDPENPTGSFVIKNCVLEV